jgi:hypothetical protein
MRQVRMHCLTKRARTAKVTGQFCYFTVLLCSTACRTSHDWQIIIDEPGRQEPGRAPKPAVLVRVSRGCSPVGPELGLRYLGFKAAAHLTGDGVNGGRVADQIVGANVQPEHGAPSESANP